MVDNGYFLDCLSCYFGNLSCFELIEEFMIDIQQRVRYCDSFI